MTNLNKITVPGGKLVVIQNVDPEYPGLSVHFETEEGELIQLATVEAHRENVNMYIYADPKEEDYTDKEVIAIHEFYEATGVYSKKLTNIIWDIDLEEGEIYEEIVKDLELPSEVCLPKYLAENGSEDEINEYLTNTYDYCVMSYVVEDVKND